MSREKDRVETLIEKEKWAEAREAINRELKDDPNNHWLLTRLSTTYYEEGKYIEALEAAVAAKAIKPNCPLVLWDNAGALDMLGREREALKIYRKLIGMGIDKIAKEECGEGKEWATGLVTDCIYRAGCCYADLGKRDLAVKVIAHCLALLDVGAQGIYTHDEVLAKFRKLVRKPATINRTLNDAKKLLAV